MPESPSKSVTRSAGIVGAAVLLSRVLGLVREKVIAFFFPAVVGGDALNAAFRIPNLLRDLFAEGALSKAFITTFTATETQDGTGPAWRLVNRTLNFFGLLLATITCAGILAAPQIVDLMFLGKGFDLPLDPAQHFGFTSKRELTVYLTRIIFPFLMLISFAAVAMGLLNSKGIFGIPALASSFFNVVALIFGVAGYYLSPAVGLHPATGMAVGFVAGGAAQFLVQVPSMRRIGFRYQPIIGIEDPRLRQLLRLMAPAILGSAALQVNVFTNSIFASEGEGWLTWITRAFRLMHLPIGMFGVAISTVALPSFARHVAAGRLDAFRRDFAHALRLALFLTLPATLLLLVLAEPVCRLIFEGGAATALDTQQTAAALFFYAFGLCGYSAVKITTDGFYAFQDTRTPVNVSLLTIMLNIMLNYLFIYQIGLDHRSLAISTSLTITLNFLLLLVLLRRRAGGLSLTGIPGFLGRLLLAAGAMTLVAWQAATWSAAFFGTATLVAQGLHVLLPALAGVLVFVAAGRLLRLHELEEIWRALR